MRSKMHASAVSRPSCLGMHEHVIIWQVKQVAMSRQKTLTLASSFFSADFQPFELFVRPSHIDIDLIAWQWAPFALGLSEVAGGAKGRAQQEPDIGCRLCSNTCNEPVISSLGCACSDPVTYFCRSCRRSRRLGVDDVLADAGAHSWPQVQGCAVPGRACSSSLAASMMTFETAARVACS